MSLGWGMTRGTEPAFVASNFCDLTAVNVAASKRMRMANPRGGLYSCCGAGFTVCEFIS
jgi:hypothetical protein